MLASPCPVFLLPVIVALSLEPAPERASLTAVGRRVLRHAGGRPLGLRLGLTVTGPPGPPGPPGALAPEQTATLTLGR